MVTTVFFNEASFDKYLNNKYAAINKEIEGYTDSDLLRMDIDKRLEVLMAQNKIRVPSLLEKNMTISVRPEKLTGRQLRMQRSIVGELYDVTFVTYRFPLDAEPDFFRYKPKKFSPLPVPVTIEIHQGNLELTFMYTIKYSSKSSLFMYSAKAFE